MSKILPERVVVPRWPVIACALAAVFSSAVAVDGLAGGGPRFVPALLVGYLLGAVAAVAFASVHRALRDARRNHPRFRVERGLDVAARIAMWAGLGGGLVDAFLLATELAK